MRVLFVSHTFPLPGEPLSNVGGMQRLAVEQRAALERHPGIDLTSLLLESSSRWTEARTVPFLASLLWRIPAAVRAQGIDVVLFSSMVTASLTPVLRRMMRGSGVVFAATPVGRDVTLPNPVYQKVVPETLRALDLVLPISRATAAECVARGLPGDRAVVVPCGVEVARFPPADRAAVRSGLLRSVTRAGEPPLPDDALLLCSVGRHQERKGFHWFVEEVMPRLPENVVFLLGGEGPTTARIRAAVERLGLQRRVRVLGRVSEDMLRTLFRGSDLFVMPNVPVPGDIEGFGVVMLEAGLCGLPIVAAELEGIRDVVRAGENGVLVPAADSRAFVDAIYSFRSDPAGLRDASARAAAWTAERFSWEVVVEMYVDALQDSVARASGRAG